MTARIPPEPQAPQHGRKKARSALRGPAIVRRGPGAVVVTVLAMAAVAGITVGLLQLIAPGPPSGRSGSVTGSYAHHPVVITLPAGPGSYLGAYTSGVPRSYAPMAALSRSVQARFNVALYYSGWGEPFKTGFAQAAASRGAVPLIQVDPGKTSLAAIAGGSYDGYLRSFATAVAAFGAQTHQGVIIGFGHEPNGYWYPWGRTHVSPRTWVAAWRHVVTVFRREGADDVTWLWTVNIIDKHGGIPSPLPWWPDSKYVTWVGIDGYYYKPPETFAGLFGPTIAAIRTVTTDPVLIAETGAAPAAGKASKIGNLFAGVHEYGLLGLVWFNASRLKDWRLDSVPATDAFRRGARAYIRPAP
ncbi:MAG: glycoside hydrolase family 26 protein [Streptosporangiaceae bacterium]